MNWNDFNSAQDYIYLELLPKGALVKVRMNLKPGGYNDPERNWTGGYATRNLFTGSIYLNTEFVVLEGPYAYRKIWGRIGLYSEKSEEWAKIGRAFIKGILNSAHGLSYKDISPAAQNARKVKGFEDLDGIEFLALVDIEIDQSGKDRNVIKYAITCDHRDYAALMGASTPLNPVKSAPKLSSLPPWAQTAEGVS